MKPVTTYVLGAGASLHAGYPLASALGSTLARWAERNTPKGHDYRARLAQLINQYSPLDDFEAIMTELLECPLGSKASTFPSSERANLIANIQEAIRECFDTIRAHPMCLYDRLAQDHIHEGDTIITFNYDLGVERALRSAGHWEIDDGYGFRIKNTQQSSAVPVLKLHGSTNWRGLLFGGSPGFGVACDSLGSRPVLFFRPDLEYLGYQEFKDPLCGHLSGVATISALIMPSLNKTFHHQTTFGNEWEPFWDHLWQHAKNALEAADDIVIIGYSLPCADKRARELLLRTTNKTVALTICCGRTSAAIGEAFRNNKFTNIKTVPTFEDWLARKK